MNHYLRDAVVAIALLVAASTAQSSSEELVVANCCGSGGYVVFPAASSGNIAPLREPRGDRNTMGVAVDMMHREIFVTNYDPRGRDPVSVFALDASGDDAPLRTIAGPATGLWLPIGVAVDPVHDEVFVANYGNRTVSVFARNASGNVPPIRSFTVSDVVGPRRIAVDPANDELIVLTPYVLVVYSRTASGNPLPIRWIAVGLGTQDPQGLAVDTKNDEIYVTSGSDGAVSVYPRSVNYHDPLRIIKGSATELDHPAGLTVDPFNDELLVSSVYSVKVFARTADGNVAPKRSISGSATRLGTVLDLAIASYRAPIPVVEYYNPALDHYFITSLLNEIAILDAGTQIKGWSRTGHSFQTFTATQVGTAWLCRFYIPPAFGDSHFYGRNEAECKATLERHPALILEDPSIMQMSLPIAGSCPPTTKPIYRVFSNRIDANHRYMGERSVRDEMIAKGWLAEGDGPDLVVMCAPDSSNIERRLRQEAMDTLGMGYGHGSACGPL